MAGMNILALDTTMNACSAAVSKAASDGIELYKSYEELKRGHAERIVPMLRGVMEEAQITFSDLDRIAVTTGPGTFTGIRIGVATARGLAFAVKRPVVGLSSLRVIAEIGANFLREAKGQNLAVAIDARKDQIYFQLFGLERNHLTEPVVCDPETAAACLSAGTTVAIGSGAAMLVDANRNNAINIVGGMPDVMPDAAILAELARDLPETGGPIKPLYLRPPDAKPQIGKSIPRRP